MSTAMEQIVAGLEATDRRLQAMEKREAAARADAASRARREAQYRDSQERQTRFADYQERVDSVLSAFGERAPAPVAGEGGRAYTVRLLSLLQQKLPPFLDKKVNVAGRAVSVADLADLPLSRLDDVALKVVEPQIVEAARLMATDNDAVLPGEMKKRETVTPTGHTRRDYIGRRSFVIDLQSPSSRIVNWADRDGRFPRN